MWCFLISIVKRLIKDYNQRNNYSTIRKLSAFNLSLKPSKAYSVTATGVTKIHLLFRSLPFYFSREGGSTVEFQ